MLRRELEARTDRYQAAAELVAAHLRHALRASLRMHPNVVPTRVSWRVKSPGSTLKKLRALQLPGSSTISEVERRIDDLAGARIVCDYLPDVETIRGYLQQHSAFTVLRSKTRDYIAHPKDGYRAVHMVARVPTGFGQTKCEIQIRTMLQHAWAEKTHDLLYKLGRSKLANIPAQIRNLTRIQSDLLANADEMALQLSQAITAASS
jgi:putative GTP pyrophosphokinase